jgi:hypothetical protein
MYIKNSNDKKSASLTLMIVSFTIVSLWLMLSIVSETFGLNIKEFSSTEAMSYLTPILMLYFGRRYFEDKTPKND